MKVAHIWIVAAVLSYSFACVALATHGRTLPMYVQSESIHLEQILVVNTVYANWENEVPLVTNISLTGTFFKALAIDTLAKNASSPLYDCSADDELWLARIIRSESASADYQVAIGEVVLNRQLIEYRGAKSFKEQALDTAQYSGFLPSSPQYEENIGRGGTTNLQEGNILEEKAWASAKKAANTVCNLTARDKKTAALWYYSPESMVPKGKVAYWAEGVEPELALCHSDGRIHTLFFDDTSKGEGRIIPDDMRTVNKGKRSDLPLCNHRNVLAMN